MLKRLAAALPFLFVAAQGASAMPMPIVADTAGGGAPGVVKVQNICGTLGNCGIGMGGVNTLPRNILVPDIGTFQPEHDKRFGRYRYVPPDQGVNVEVPTLNTGPRIVAPRYTGTRTIYQVDRLSAEHVDWCYSRYKSYRAKDNSFQPNKGPRRRCVSPYN